MADLKVQIADEDDKPVGSELIELVAGSGKIVRISRIMLFNSTGQILLQKRADDPSNPWPDVWDSSSAGHVDEDEDYLQAAYREMFEEIGVSGIELNEAGYYYSEFYHQNKLMRRFVKVYNGDIDFTPNKLQASEVSGVKWFDMHDLKIQIKDKPEDFIGGLIEIIEKYF